MRSSGFPVEIRDVQDLSPIKAEAGVPAGMGSCHTALVAGYFVEGHVPAEDVKRLLAEKPDALGLAVPGMPLGSPGMVQGERRQAYEVVLVARDGSTSVFTSHPGTQ
ncbi:MAG: CopG family transcriptional regulator [Steroidobacteraceae bacterium]|nr:CopG family transcriptional regulator [Steroidobacteraceae bacterium]